MMHKPVSFLVPIPFSLLRKEKDEPCLFEFYVIMSVYVLVRLVSEIEKLKKKKSGKYT
jgi:hypothetical protein